jgi:hypothetical protein
MRDAIAEGMSADESASYVKRVCICPRISKKNLRNLYASLNNRGEPMKKTAKAIAPPKDTLPTCPKCLKQVLLMEDGLCVECSEEAQKSAVAYKEQCELLMKYVEQLFGDLLRGCWESIDRIRKGEEGAKITVNFGMTFKGHSTIEADVALAYAERHKATRSVFVEDPRQATLPGTETETEPEPGEPKQIGFVDVPNDTPAEQAGTASAQEEV